MLWSDIYGSFVFALLWKPVGLLLNLYVPYILPQKPSTGFQHVPKCGLKIWAEQAYALINLSLSEPIPSVLESNMAIVKGSTNRIIFIIIKLTYHLVYVVVRNIP